MSQAAPLQTLGKFHLIAELGHGGMADVYLAVARGPAGFSKLQVIKQLRPSLAENPEVLAMFLDEARLAARLNHPNVVQTYEVEQQGESCYLAMEYLEGQPLDRLLRRARKQGGVPRSLHLRILTDTLAGLHHAHELCDFDGTPLRVVHRDVSPQNIFVTYEGQIKVVDFGIAKAANGSAETRTGVLKGKIAYMAPEQALGEELDRRADLFAVGILLHEALSGQKFWGNATDIQILHRLSNGLLPGADALGPDVPEALRAICQRALAHKPEDRYATANEFRDDLERVLRGESAASGRDVGVYLSGLFDDRRKQARVVIEEQLKLLRNQEPLPERRPHLFSQTMSLSASHESSASQLSAPIATPFASESPTHAHDASSRRAWPIVAAGLVAAAIGAFGLRAWTRPSAAGQVPAASVAPAAVSIDLSVSAEPPEARLFLDGAPLPSNPYKGRHALDGASHRLRVEAAGFQTSNQLISFDANRAVTIALSPEKAEPAASSEHKPADPRADRKASAGHAAPAVPAQLAVPATQPAASAAPPANEHPDDLPNPPTKKPRREIDKDDPWN